MWPFSNITEKIQDGVRWAFEAIYPTINSFWNMLYGVNMNPFEMPNGLTTLFMSLSIIFIILFGVSHLLKNVGAYTQKRMMKKTIIILWSIGMVILLWNLMKTNEKEVTFNMGLVYFRQDVSPEDSNINVTTESLWYAGITWDNAYAKDPFSDVVAGGWNDKSRTNITISPFHAFGVRWSIKYTPNFALAVWVLPMQVGYNDVAKPGVYFNQADMLGKSLPNGVQKGTSICPTPASNAIADSADPATATKSWLSAFGSLLPSENTNIRYIEGKKMTSTDNGYKWVACIEKITPYRKDIIFSNEATGKGKTVNFEVVPMYYPLVLLGQYANVDISSNIDTLTQDFLFATDNSSNTGSGSTAPTDADKQKNEGFVALYDKLNALGALDRGNTSTTFNVDKLTSVVNFNAGKGWDEFAVDGLITEVTTKLNSIKTNLEAIKTNQAHLAGLVGKTDNASQALEKSYRDSITKNKQEMLNTYSSITGTNNNLIEIFKGYLGSTPTYQKLQNSSVETLEPEISSMISGITNSKNLFYTDTELKFQELYKEFKTFATTNNISSIANAKNPSDFFIALENEKAVHWQNLFSGNEIILKILCTDKTGETLKKLNISLKSAGVPELTENVVNCSAGVGGTIVDKERLQEVLDKIVSVQYNKDKVTSVNLISYYGKILTNSKDNKQIGRINDIKYDVNSTLPTKIGNYTLVSPLYYYKKLITQDYSGLPTFINLKNIEGKVYMPEGVYDLKIGGVKSWYKDLDAVNGDKFGNDMSVFGIPLLASILFILIFLANVVLLLGAFVFIISYFIILIKD